MIGQLIRLYCEGRRDAQHGKRRKRLPQESDDNRTIYLLGVEDERIRMHVDRRLVQTEMQLEPPDAVGS